MIRTGPSDSVRAWVVYPERRTKAPVVVVVHEIFGLSSWVRGVADQLAADGFIAIAPDLLTGKVPPVPGTDTVASQAATAAVRSLQSQDVQRQIAAVGQYGMSLPAAEKRYGVVGFCWGGSASFNSAVTSPAGQGAAVVYYGGSPATASLATSRCRSSGCTAERTRESVHGPPGRLGDEGAWQALRAPYVRRRWPRVPSPAGGTERREPRRRTAGVADDDRLLPIHARPLT